jgi:hypothetical protein
MTCIFCGCIIVSGDRYREAEHTCICHHCAEREIQVYIKERKERK